VHSLFRCDSRRPEGGSILESWTHNPSSEGMITREQTVVNRLHHLEDGQANPEIRSAIGQNLELIRDLTWSRGKRRDFAEQWDRTHDEC
jgi:hypothetical protein